MSVTVRPRICWPTMLARGFLVLAAFALAGCAATLIGLAPLLPPITVHVGQGMACASVLSLIAAFFIL